MFTCYLCEKQPVFTRYFCDACTETRRIFSIYGANECREILRRVCIRECQQRENKINIELKKSKEEESQSDDCYYKKTRSKTKENKN